MNQLENKWTYGAKWTSYCRTGSENNAVLCVLGLLCVKLHHVFQHDVVISFFSHLFLFLYIAFFVAYSFIHMYSCG